MKKKILSGLLCLCMLLSLLPAAVQATEAESSAPCALGCALEPDHLGECVLHEARYQAEADGEWLYGSLSTACSNVFEGGRVELLRDIDQPEPLELRKALTLSSIDPDDPCKIIYTTQDDHDAWLLTVYADVTLTHIILDGGREEGRTTHIELVGVPAGTLTMDAGAVIQNNDNIDTAKGAGGLRVLKEGTAVMLSDSYIRNCRAVAGGGAAVATVGATLRIDGGVIEHCQAFVGGGVFIQKGSGGGGKLYLNSGGLYHNEAHKTLEDMSFNYRSPAIGTGGGVCVEGGYVYMLGGAISGNYAESTGGGIYLNEGLAQFAGGEITENQAGIYGGGVAVTPNNKSTKVLMGNSPYISGNTSGDPYFYDMYLDGAEDFSASYATIPMRVAAPLGESARIGVSRWLRPDGTHPYRVVATPYQSYVITEDDLDRFFSNDSAYIVLLREGDIVLATADVVFDNQGHGTAPKAQHVDESRKVVEPAALTQAGYAFGGWFLEPGCETPWDFETDTIIELQTEPLTLYAKWDIIPYAIAYELDGGENADANPDSYTIESDTITLKAPTKENHTFLGWTWAGEDTPRETASIPLGSTGEYTFTAHWSLNTYPVTFDIQGHGSAPEGQTAEHGSLVVRPDDLRENGWTFGGWYREPPCENAWDFETDTVTAPVTLYAKWSKKSSPAVSRPTTPPPEDLEDDKVPTRPAPDLSGLDRENHFAYIVGYPDGTVGPENNMTRSEAVTIFFRLMTDDFRAAHQVDSDPFPDVTAEAWYHNAVSTGVHAGLILGLPDGTFGGEQSITRAEFAAIAARFLSDQTAPDSGFSDLAGHWAKEEADRAVAAGWLEGYPDGLFHPDDPITRAEVVTLVNRMLERTPAPASFSNDMLRWPDNPTSAWYYAAMQEATNAHSYDWDGETGREFWTGLRENRDWTQLERP